MIKNNERSLNYFGQSSTDSKFKYQSIKDKKIFLSKLMGSEKKNCGQTIRQNNFDQSLKSSSLLRLDLAQSPSPSTLHHPSALPNEKFIPTPSIYNKNKTFGFVPTTQVPSMNSITDSYVNVIIDSPTHPSVFNDVEQKLSFSTKPSFNTSFNASFESHSTFSGNLQNTIKYSHISLTPTPAQKSTFTFDLEENDFFSRNTTAFISIPSPSPSHLLRDSFHPGSNIIISSAPSFQKKLQTQVLSLEEGQVFSSVCSRGSSDYININLDEKEDFVILYSYAIQTKSNSNVPVILSILEEYMQHNLSSILLDCIQPYYQDRFLSSNLDSVTYNYSDRMLHSGLQRVLSAPIDHIDDLQCSSEERKIESDCFVVEGGITVTWSTDLALKKKRFKRYTTLNIENHKRRNGLWSIHRCSWINHWFIISWG